MSNFKQTFTQKQLQNLSLSYKMKLSISLLQLNSLQLKEYLEKELLENPMYEVDMPMNFSSLKECETWDIADEAQSLRDELLLQMDETINLYVLETILHNCDRNGYLRVSDEELANVCKVSIQEVQDCLTRIHECTPYGIAAKDVSECLAIQLQHLHPTNELALQLVRFHLEDIAKNHLEKLANEYQVNQSQIKEAIACIQTCNPRPGSPYDFENVVFMKPDILLEFEDDELRIIMPNYFNVVENEYYKGKNLNKEETKFIKEKRTQGKVILDCLQHRKETLHHMMQVIIGKQSKYLKKEGPLVYLRMIDLAQALSLHETTISRAMKDKYIEFEGCIVPMKSLLCKQVNDTSVDTILSFIKQTIANEDDSATLSDQMISNMLLDKNIRCSRRTIAKYRSDLRIPSASIRKRLKEVSE